MKRERSQITTEFVERKGLPFTEFFDFQLQAFGMHEETKWPLITAITDKMTDNLSDNCAYCILAFEPDPMLKTVLKAWIGVDVKPKEGVEINGKFNKNSPGDIINASIPWTGIWQYGYGPRRYATTVEINAVRWCQCKLPWCCYGPRNCGRRRRCNWLQQVVPALCIK